MSYDDDDYGGGVDVEKKKEDCNLMNQKNHIKYGGPDVFKRLRDIIFMMNSMTVTRKVKLTKTTTKDSSMEPPRVDGKDTHVDGVEDPRIGGELFVGETKQETMTDKRDITRDDDYSGKDQSTREYLQFGGGFCSDEEDVGIEFGGRETSSISETFNMITGFDSEEEENPETGSSNLNSNRRANLSRSDVSVTQFMNDNVDDDSNVSSTMLMDSLQVAL